MSYIFKDILILTGLTIILTALAIILSFLTLQQTKCTSYLMNAYYDYDDVYPKGYWHIKYCKNWVCGRHFPNIWNVLPEKENLCLYYKNENKTFNE